MENLKDINTDNYLRGKILKHGRMLEKNKGKNLKRRLNSWDGRFPDKNFNKTPKWSDQRSFIHA